MPPTPLQAGGSHQALLSTTSCPAIPNRLQNTRILRKMLWNVKYFRISAQIHLREPLLWQQELVKKKLGWRENSPCREKTDKVMGAVGGMFWRGGFNFFIGFLPADSFWRAWRNAGNSQLVHVAAGFIFHQQRICLQLCGVLGSWWEILAFPRRAGWLRTPQLQSWTSK